MYASTCTNHAELYVPYSLHPGFPWLQWYMYDSHHLLKFQKTKSSTFSGKVCVFPMSCDFKGFGFARYNGIYHELFHEYFRRDATELPLINVVRSSIPQWESIKKWILIIYIYIYIDRSHVQHQPTHRHFSASQVDVSSDAWHVAQGSFKFDQGYVPTS